MSTKMKSRPNLTPEEFMAGGAADQTERQSKHKKMIELPYLVYVALRNRAIADSLRAGKRVSENSLIMEALTKYLKL